MVLIELPTIAVVQCFEHHGELFSRKGVRRSLPRQ